MVISIYIVIILICIAGCAYWDHKKGMQKILFILSYILGTVTAILLVNYIFHLW